MALAGLCRWWAHNGRTGRGTRELPDLPFDLDLELHKGGLHPHRKFGGTEEEKVYVAREV